MALSYPIHKGKDRAEQDKEEEIPLKPITKYDVLKKRWVRLPSVIEGDNADVFEIILLHYVPPPARVLDTTCGKYKQFWKNLIPLLKMGLQYYVVWMDLRPVGHVQADLKQLPFKDNYFDAVIFDPPYTKKLLIEPPGHKIWKPDERYAMSGEIISEHMIRRHFIEANRVLKPGGVIITKLMDTDKLWHFKYYNLLQEYRGPLRLEALHIQYFKESWRLHIRTPKVKRPAEVHAYWFIIRKT